MTTIQDRIIKDFFELKDSLIYEAEVSDEDAERDATNQIKQFLIQSIKEVEEETKGDVLNKLHAMVCNLATDKCKYLAKEDCLELIRYQIERIYGKKLLSITNKEKQNV